ncbi:hypothetical protein GOP47_0017699, partial [Adiantum capillus-veneris]
WSNPGRHHVCKGRLVQVSNGRPTEIHFYFSKSRLWNPSLPRIRRSMGFIHDFLIVL